MTQNILVYRISRSSIEQLDFDAVIADILSGPGEQRESSHEDAAVALRADLVVERQDKVRILLPGDHHIAAAAVGVDTVILHRLLALRMAARHPPVETLAVEQRDPALAGLGLCRTAQGQCAESQKADGECQRAYHRKSSLVF